MGCIADARCHRARRPACWSWASTEVSGVRRKLRLQRQDEQTAASVDAFSSNAGSGGRSENGCEATTGWTQVGGISARTSDKDQGRRVAVLPYIQDLDNEGRESAPTKVRCIRSTFQWETSGADGVSAFWAQKGPNLLAGEDPGSVSKQRAPSQRTLHFNTVLQWPHFALIGGTKLRWRGMPRDVERLADGVAEGPGGGAMSAAQFSGPDICQA